MMRLMFSHFGHVARRLDSLEKMALMGKLEGGEEDDEQKPDVIHTVGPVARGHVGKAQKELLSQCYQNSLALVKEHGLRSVAFPCISTGIYGFPNEPAAEIALETAKTWIKKNVNEVDRVVFCVFLDTDFKIYKEKMSRFFPQDEDVDEEGAEAPAEEVKKDTPPSKKSKSQKRGSDDDDEDGEEEEQEERAPGDVAMESQTDPFLSSPQAEAAVSVEDTEMASQGYGDEAMSQEESEDKKDAAEGETVPGKTMKSEPAGAAREDEEMDCSEDVAERAIGPSASEPEASPRQTSCAPKSDPADAGRDVPDNGDSQDDVRPEKPNNNNEDAVKGEAPQSAEVTPPTAITGPAEETRTQGGDSAESEVIHCDLNQSKDRTGDLEEP
ncbi:ADP-ribose glycohydrolase MACROD2-like isoform X2 [Scleropages formosus]|uniref:ADP-ribose glycohydrolase MACROD2-like isoform X2 n=1 Tax=Scleropages formosus TaxID=113540 RepID=UPI0008789D11|nr:ADP-ribose glycohydrolase MACROD2-like isoform X2 [Scleropages formosus]